MLGDAVHRQCGFKCSLDTSSIDYVLFTCSTVDPSAVLLHVWVTLYPPNLQSAETVEAIKSAVQEWSSASPGLLIGGQILVVDGSCPPLVSSFLDPECGTTETSAPPSPSTSLKLLDNLTAVIVMGVLGVLLLVLAVVIVVMCCIFCYNRCRLCKGRGK